MKVRHSSRGSGEAHSVCGLGAVCSFRQLEVVRCISSQCATIAGTTYLLLWISHFIFPVYTHLSHVLHLVIFLAAFILTAVHGFLHPSTCLLSHFTISPLFSLLLTDGDTREVSKINSNINKHKGLTVL